MSGITCDPESLAADCAVSGGPTARVAGDVALMDTLATAPRLAPVIGTAVCDGLVA